MKVTLVQQDIIWANPRENCKHLDEMLLQHKGADLYVLPEMFSTGFATKPRGIAEEEPCFSLEWLKEKAAEYDAAFTGSVALHVNGTYRNRMYFVKPDGGVTFYDKHHLFTYGGETEFFTPGEDRVVVRWRGVRFRLTVCYDIRFPLWCRNLSDYDALICIASWPKRRQSNLDILLQARAIENQCYVLGVNRVGTDASTLDYTGGTVVIDPYGTPVARTVPGKEGVISAVLDMQKLIDFRKQFPVLGDADKYENAGFIA